jgi:glycosyltransferase involved in cell wall biosynthesis
MLLGHSVRLGKHIENIEGLAYEKGGLRYVQNRSRVRIMTFLLISHTSDMNGAERSLLDLAVSIAAREDLLVLCPDEGPLTQCLWAQNVPVMTMTLPRPQIGLLNLLSFVVLWFPTVWRLKKLIVGRQITVVYNNTIDGLYGPFAAQLAQVPCVWHIREVSRSTLAHKILSWLLSWLPDRVVFNSQATMRAYSTEPPAHWQVIYNGIAISDIVPHKCVDGKPIVVGFVGQMVELKRPEVFLQAVALSQKSVPGLRGMMAGDGKLLVEMKTLAKSLGIADQVGILGFVSSMAYFYAQLDMLVLPSERESFGRVLIEAMAACCPVIASHVDGVPEVVEDGVSGYLVSPGDVDAFTEKIVSLALDPELRMRMGTAGRQRVLENFTLERYRENLTTVLHSVV